MNQHPLWQPSAAAIEQAPMSAFRREVAEKTGQTLNNYDDLHHYSVTHPGEFWRHVWDFCALIGEPGDSALENSASMLEAKFFPQAQLNFAENLLKRKDDTEALVFRAEDKIARKLTYAQLNAQVAQFAAGLAAHGVGVGARVAGYVPNAPEAIIAALAAASLGAVWCSCSPDFGVAGVLDRFGQIAPTILVTVDRYYYNGKTHDNLAKVVEIVAGLPSVNKAVVFSLDGQSPDISHAPDRLQTWSNFIADYADLSTPTYTRLAFNHPLYILFSSGTTGVPKCIVHSAGGTLLKHLSEHRLHSGVGAGTKLFYFTTCGWMMWNWLVSGLACGATLMLYDGSPFYPSGNVLFDYAQDERCEVFGTSAKFIDSLAKADISPAHTHDLSRMRLLMSTGSPLSEEGFEYVYSDISADVQLASISGGTDICGCFVLGDPTSPVFRGEIQRAALGVRVEIWSEAGAPISQGRGELVCSAPFPSMPVGFYNDADGSRYRAAYFARFPGVWCHGDFVEMTANGGYIIHGRSDATLNPGGVRIGTAEIYRQVEQLPQVLESLVIGQQWQQDTRVVLFVLLRDGLVLDEALIEQIRTQIRRNTTPRHVPAKVVQVSDIPRTKSGKIVELAVREIVHGRAIKNQEALANPEALALFANRAELAD